jgi:hypothetical protein
MKDRTGLASAPSRLRSRAGFGADLASEPILLPEISQTGSKRPMQVMIRSRISYATANIPSPRLRAEKAPAGQSELFPCCNLTRQTKRTRPWYDCPTSSLRVILRVAATIV